MSSRSPPAGGDADRFFGPNYFVWAQVATCLKVTELGKPGQVQLASLAMNLGATTLAGWIDQDNTELDF